MTCGHERPTLTIQDRWPLAEAFGELVRTLGGLDLLDVAAAEIPAGDLTRVAEAISDVIAHRSWREAPDDETAEKIAAEYAEALRAGDYWAVMHPYGSRPCAARLAAHGRLTDTPPAVAGDSLCRDCRSLETARVFPAGGADPARIAASLHAAGAELIADGEPVAVSLTTGGEGGF